MFTHVTHGHRPRLHLTSTTQGRSERNPALGFSRVPIILEKLPWHKHHSQQQIQIVSTTHGGAHFDDGSSRKTDDAVFFQEKTLHPTDDRALTEIKRVLTDARRVDFMKNATYFNGGWEAWVQIELAVSLNAVSIPFVCIRESPIYGLLHPSTGQRIDLLVIPKSNLADSYGGFEIKCRNINMSPCAHANSLMKNFIADIGKFENSNLHHGYWRFLKPTRETPLAMYAIAITTDPRDLLLESAGDRTARARLSDKIHWCYLSQVVGRRYIPRGFEARKFDVLNDLLDWNKGEDSQAARDRIKALDRNLYLLWYKQEMA